jgi:hypothetical protein
MDYVNLGGSVTVEGLGKMLEAVLGEPHGYTDSRLVEVPIALFIMSLAKLAEDKAEWFPLGKWATIQAIEDRIEKEIANEKSPRVADPLTGREEDSDGYTN